MNVNHMDNNGDYIIGSRGSWRGFDTDQIITINNKPFVVVAVYMSAIKVAENCVGYINYDNMFDIDLEFLYKNKVEFIE